MFQKTAQGKEKEIVLHQVRRQKNKKKTSTKRKER